MKRLIAVVGALLMSAGMLSNNIVFSFNAGMPFYSAAAVNGPAAVDGRLPITPATKLVWLADVLPWRTSLGDWMLAVGIVLFAAGLAALAVEEFQAKRR